MKDVIGILQKKIEKKISIYKRIINPERIKDDEMADLVLSGALGGMRIVLEEFIPEAIKEAEE